MIVFIVELKGIVNDRYDECDLLVQANRICLIVFGDIYSENINDV